MVTVDDTVNNEPISNKVMYLFQAFKFSSMIVRNSLQQFPTQTLPLN